MHSNLVQLLPYLGITLEGMCHESGRDWHSSCNSWEYPWKQESRDGHDDYKGREVHYGNKEYIALAGVLYLRDRFLADRL